MNTELAQIHLSDDTRDIGALIAENQAVLGEAVCESPFGSLTLSFSGAEELVPTNIVNRHGHHRDVFSLDAGSCTQKPTSFLKSCANITTKLSNCLARTPQGCREWSKPRACSAPIPTAIVNAVTSERPLRQKLDTLAAWVTGQRQDQGDTHSAGAASNR